MEIINITQKKFQSLFKYVATPTVTEEIAWHATEDYKLAATVLSDKIDHDFGYVIMGSDGMVKYTCIDAGDSFPTKEAATTKLMERLKEMHPKAK